MRPLYSYRCKNGCCHVEQHAVVGRRPYWRLNGKRTTLGRIAVSLDMNSGSVWDRVKRGSCLQQPKHVQYRGEYQPRQKPRPRPQPPGEPSAAARFLALPRISL